MLRRVTSRVKIGVLSGSFDPVHAGHIGLSLAAKRAADLDEVYFAPEVKPRHKTSVTHIAHRIAMLKLAVKPHEGLRVLELNDTNFSVAKTLPKLVAKFPRDQLYFICGEDMLRHMPDWPLVGRLMESIRLIVGRRSSDGSTLSLDEISSRLGLEQQPIIVNLDFKHISSSAIREALGKGKRPMGLLKTTETYIRKHWLYTSLFSDSTKS